MNSEETASTDSQPAVPLSDSIRITRQGKIGHWVKHGLDFFQENPDKPLTLHTSPADVAQSTIPRLISIVEIVKREYLKTLDVSVGQLTGLHQYNELQWEQRKKQDSPKLTLAPYMKVTLCRKALPGMHEKKDVTYQTPQTRRLSKTTKARLKKKAKQQMP
ncbi:hypothetical protein F4604DRAFT_1649431 [Suillus subluteus]|nr:hypothetical protein F4604DRAFT_1649431 [Suillus subluteus]